MGKIADAARSRHGLPVHAEACSPYLFLDSSEMAWARREAASFTSAALTSATVARLLRLTKRKGAPLSGADAGINANLPNVDLCRRTAMTAIVHLVRHGEVVNPHRLLYGRLPGFPLSSLGRRHAEEFSSEFCERPIAEVISSPLERAQETGGILAKLLGVQLRTDTRLVESWARFEGREFKYRPYFRPAEWRYYLNPWKPTWGEPFFDIAERMAAAVLDARPAGGQGEVICVSHAATIYTVRRYFEGRRIQHLSSARIVDYLSATSICFEGDVVTDVSYREFPKRHSSDGRSLGS